jgi:hypothetical protein
MGIKRITEIKNVFCISWNPSFTTVHIFLIERRDAETAEKDGREGEEKKKTKSFNNILNSFLSASPRLCVQNQNKKCVW